MFNVQKIYRSSLIKKSLRRDPIPILEDHPSGSLNIFIHKPSGPGWLITSISHCRVVGSSIAGWSMSWKIPTKHRWLRATSILGNLHLHQSMTIWIELTINLFQNPNNFPHAVPPQPLNKRQRTAVQPVSRAFLALAASKLPDTLRLPRPWYFNLANQEREQGTLKFWQIWIWEDLRRLSLGCLGQWGVFGG